MLTLEAINHASLKFLNTQNETTLYKQIVLEANHLFGSDYGSIIVSQGGEFVRVYSN